MRLKYKKLKSVLKDMIDKRVRTDHKTDTDTRHRQKCWGGVATSDQMCSQITWW